MADKLRTMKDRASRLYADGKLREALTLYERIAADEPRELACLLKAGDLHRKLGQIEEAVAAYAEVARQYAEDGLLLKAIAVCKLILTADPDHTSTQTMLADLYARRRTGDVPSLPVAEPSLVPDAGVMSQWPGATQVVELEPEAPGVMAAWPTSQPIVMGEKVGATWPIVAGTPLDEDLEGSALDIEVTEPVVEDDGVIELTDVMHEGHDETFNEKLDLAAVRGAHEPERAPEAELSPPLIPLFSDLPKRAFVELLVKMKMHQLRRGAIVIAEGEAGDSFYVVASGLLSVSRAGSEGKEVRLAQLGEGAFFGEMAMLQDGVRTATVRVEEDAQVFEISRELLAEVTEQFPTVATAVKNFYRQRLLASAMATHPLFAPLSEMERRELMTQFKSRSFLPDDVILEQGKKGSGLYLLLHGKVEVRRAQDEDEAPTTVAELASGDLFGEMSLLTGEPTNASVVAVEDAFVLRLAKKRFEEVVMANDTIKDLVGRLSEERSAANEKLVGQQLDAHGAVVV